MTANTFVDWTHNGDRCGRHSSMLTAPLCSLSINVSRQK
jgi:hypothetical protein